MQARRNHTDPVFVDRTGRRRRIFVAAGAASGITLSFVSLALIAGLTGAAPGHLPLLPESAGGPASSRSATPVPSATVRATSPLPRPPSPAIGLQVGSVSTAPTPASQSVDPTPSPTAKAAHRKVPTHTPANRTTNRP